MANSLITPSIIAQEALFQLENNCVMADKVHREYKDEFVKIGDTVTIRKPVKFIVSDGATRSNQDVTERNTSITIDKRKHVSWKFSTQDLTLTIEEYSERYIKPAMIALANQVDVDVALEGYQSFWNGVGTPGTTPATFAALSSVAQRMDEGAVPDDGHRCLVLNPAARWSMSDGLKGLFNADMVKDFVRKGFLGEIANFGIYGDQNIQNHTTGTYTTGSTPLVNGVTANGATQFVTDGWANNTLVLRKGDIFTLAGVNDVNPVFPFDDLGRLKQFVVAADVTSSGTGTATITIVGEINDGSTAATQAYQNVTALPADNAAITPLGTEATSYPQNLGFHRNALALVTVPLELPDSVNFKARADWRGLSIRVIKDYDIDADEEIIRLDVMYGVEPIYPDLGVRLWG